MDKLVHFFGAGKADGTGSMKSTLGGKGAGLAEMSRIGLPVPAGFTISADVCHYYQAHKNSYPASLKGQVEKSLRQVERVMKARFGHAKTPLLVSVRSGAAISMPGMMDTVLNLGLNDKTVAALAKVSKNERFAWDCYRRFVQMYGDVVLGLKPASSAERDPFELILEQTKETAGIRSDQDLTVAQLKDLVARFKKEIKERTGRSFPEDPEKQLWGAIGSVFESWNNPRAITYRRLNRIPSNLGTAVNVQSMVYGNIGADSGTGVAFTRSPSSGEAEFFGEYLLNAQGEDVVAGTRTPKAILGLKKEMPKVYGQLLKVRDKLEKHYREMQDIEFTIQQGKLWMLQTRTGKRTAFAAIRIAVEMVAEGLISDQEALLRIDPEQLNQLLRPVFEAGAKEQALKSGRLLGKGLPAGPGAACGRIVFSAEEAVRRKAAGEEVILVRMETSPDDIEGMNAALGIVTSRGGMTSHAALVGRQMGKVCVVGCADLLIDAAQRTLRVAGDRGSSGAGDGGVTILAGSAGPISGNGAGRVLREGDPISIDGNTGEVIAGGIATVPSEVLQVLLQKTLDSRSSADFQRYSKILAWANKYRRLRVRANADTGQQSQEAVAFGAEGIGLCRTEHMFFGPGKIEKMQRMILAAGAEERRAALKGLLPLQRQDFVEIFRAMQTRPVTIRLLDPPLHEFLPHTPQDQQHLARVLGIPVERIRGAVEALHEFNPMLGFRGCRLGMQYPEISEMQARAIFEAVCEVHAQGIKAKAEVMIPLVGHVKEYQAQETIVRRVAEQVMKERGVQIQYLVGTMIEVPRAAVTSAEIAASAEFFSFGTNDLTQTTLGLSRDDSSRFLPAYLQQEIYPFDPFQSLDINGVGQLIDFATKTGRLARTDLKVGVCGEHGGDPHSVYFFHKVGLDYVSCSPYRLPIAMVAAAQAALRDDHVARSGKSAQRGKRSRGARKKTGKGLKAEKPKARAAHH